MHRHHIERYQHAHVFLGSSHAAERRTNVVILLTLFTMVGEIVAGTWFHSLALLADGWHMSTHAAALGLTALGYRLARRFAHDPRFTFGTWKIEVLAGYTSAVLLALVGLGIVYSAAQRLLRPEEIQYRDALLVATVGLVINALCAVVLHGGHEHEQHLEHTHPQPGHQHVSAFAPQKHQRQHHDLNLRAAYLHVVADALTSVLALLALGLGYWRGWRWLDPAAGIIGAVLIIRWAWLLARDTGLVLLDGAGSLPLATTIKSELERDGDTRVSDLHVWRVGTHHYACIISLIASQPKSPAEYRALLAHYPELAHVTIELQRCEDAC